MTWSPTLKIDAYGMLNAPPLTLFNLRRLTLSTLTAHAAGALRKKLQSDMSFAEIVKVSSCETLMCNRQIEKDLLRTMPSNVCFSSLSSPGVPRLRRVLRALAWLYPDIG